MFLIIYNLQFRGKPITWPHLLDTFEWDLAAHKDAPWLRMMHRLTPDHIHLSPSSRMRVYLAAQVKYLFNDRTTQNTKVNNNLQCLFNESLHKL